MFWFSIITSKFYSFENQNLDIWLWHQKYNLSWQPIFYSDGLLKLFYTDDI